MTGKKTVLKDADISVLSRLCELQTIEAKRLQDVLLDLWSSDLVRCQAEPIETTLKTTVKRTLYTQEQVQKLVDALTGAS